MSLLPFFQSLRGTFVCVSAGSVRVIVNALHIVVNVHGSGTTGLSRATRRPSPFLSSASTKIQYVVHGSKLPAGIRVRVWSMSIQNEADQFIGGSVRATQVVRFIGWLKEIVTHVYSATPVAFVGGLVRTM